MLVLAGGVGIALLFHKNPPPATEETARFEEPIRHRAEDGPRFLMEVRSAPPVAAPVHETAQGARDPARPLDFLTGLPIFEGGGDSVPRFARDYPNLTEEQTRGQPPELVHRVVDGDTLPSLAQRYLGDAARAGEILEANRDVLSNPELLPIGAALKIPAR
jgi:nucleoid-associated protein YgaU